MHLANYPTILDECVENLQDITKLIQQNNLMSSASSPAHDTALSSSSSSAFHQAEDSPRTELLKGIQETIAVIAAEKQALEQAQQVQAQPSRR